MAASAKTKQIALRVNTNLLARVDAFAAARGRYRSEVIDLALEEYLARHEGPAKPGQPPTPPK